MTALLLSFNMSAQTAPDFTVTDCHGETIHLYEILDAGQFVLIDFFFTTCGPCQAVTPIVKQTYELMGCNMYDVFYMEISPSDNNNACLNWVNNYGIEYPTIGTDGGGPAVCANYGISAYPTLVLIAPDHTIVEPDIWPINSVAHLSSILESHGIQQHECVTPIEEPSVEITLGDVTATTIEASFAPNETCASYYILSGIAADIQNWANMFGVSIAQLVKQWGIMKTEDFTYVWTDFIPGTEYTVYALPLDADDNFGELVTTTVTTSTLGGPGLSTIELSVTIVNDTTVNTLATPNDQTAVFHVGLITAEYCDEIGIDSALYYIRNDGYPQYATDEWTWTSLQSHTKYYAIATGQNANGEWGETTIVEFVTDPDAVNSNSIDNYRLFPNPANDYVVIEGDNITEVTIYNALGQEMKHERANADQVIINTSAMQNGIYFAKINNETTIRFVVNK